MKRFSNGQQVVCIHPTGLWRGVFPGPRYGELVTISKYSSIHPGYVELVEYPESVIGNPLPDCYAQEWFEPVADVNALMASIHETNEISMT